MIKAWFFSALAASSNTGIYSFSIKLTIAILALILVSWLLTRMVTRPVRQLQQLTTGPVAIGAGAGTP